MKLFVAVWVLLLAFHMVYAQENEMQSEGSLINETPNSTFIIDADTLNADCARKYECKENNGQYYFGCFFDFKDSQCRCFLGSQSECNVALSSVAQNEITGEVIATPFVFGYLKLPVVQATLFFAFVAFMLALYFLRSGNSDPVKAAVRYHRLAERYHEKGEEKMAEHYARLAEKYRELSEERKNVVEKD